MLKSQSDTMASVALRFAVSQAQRNSFPGFTDTTITGIGSVSDLEENVKSAERILPVYRSPTAEKYSSSQLKPTFDAFSELEEKAVE